MAKIKEITIDTTTEGSELVADILYDVSSQGVGIYDTKDIVDFVKDDKTLYDISTEELLKNKVVKVKAYCEIKDEKQVLNLVRERLDNLKRNSPFNLGSLEVIVDEVDPDIWWENWKKTYKPIKAGKVVIVPNWINYEKQEDEVIIKMDPGMAFGSGQHESTRMCLSFLEELNLKDKKIVDVGTGSGILALAAVALGATNVEAYDIDDVAVDAARNNAKYNNFDKYIKIDNSNLLAKVENIFDIVLANITSEVLKMLAKDLRRYVNQNGIIIISGILTSLEDEVITVFKSLGFKVIERKNLGEWVAFKLSL